MKKIIVPTMIIVVPKAGIPRELQVGGGRERPHKIADGGGPTASEWKNKSTVDGCR